MNITPGLKIKGKSLWMPHERVLIIADLHIGYEEHLNRKGILVPRSQFDEMEKEILGLLDEVKPKTIVINGDLKQEFDRISEQEWKDTFRLLEILAANCPEIILVRGNHDTILKPIIKRFGKRKIKIVNYYEIGDMIIFHGEEFDESVWKTIKRKKTLIIAHEHPAISLTEGNKTEIYKCFLLGKWKDKKIVVMPSFIPIVEGMDLRKDRILSPFLKQNLNNFEVFVVSDKVYEFGKLGNLKLINA